MHEVSLKSAVNRPHYVVVMGRKKTSERKLKSFGSLGREVLVVSSGENISPWIRRVIKLEIFEKFGRFEVIRNDLFALVYGCEVNNLQSTCLCSRRNSELTVVESGIAFN